MPNASTSPRFGDSIDLELCVDIHNATYLGNFLLLRALALQEGLEGDSLPLSNDEQAALLHVNALPPNLRNGQPQRGHEREEPCS